MLFFKLLSASICVKKPSLKYSVKADSSFFIVSSIILSSFSTVVSLGCMVKNCLYSPSNFWYSFFLPVLQLLRLPYPYRRCHRFLIKNFLLLLQHLLILLPLLFAGFLFQLVRLPCGIYKNHSTPGFLGVSFFHCLKMFEA